MTASVPSGGADGPTEPDRGGPPGEGAAVPASGESRDHGEIKKRGIELATVGLLMALALVWVQDQLGIVDTTGARLLVAVAVTLAIQGALWLVPHLGWDERLTGDEHYILVPVAAAALELGYYTWLAPATDHFFLLGWFVALVFMAGLAGLREVVVLACLMTAASLGGLALATGGAAPGTLDLVQAGVFMLVNIYTGLVFEHLRDEREERKDLRERLASEARTDHLTGLLNRRAFDRELRAEMNRLDRYDGQGAVVLLDLDFFKIFNDAHGHPAGDRALGELARVLERESRTSDRVARYGGEEFGIIMPRVSPGEAVEAAERLRAVLERHDFDGEDVLPSGRLTVSMGVASYPSDASTFEDILRVADRRLYRAKDQGRNRVCAAGD